MSDFGWSNMARLGPVQTALGSAVVLATPTRNRSSVLELVLLAVLAGNLVALHYLVKVARLPMGFDSYVGALGLGGVIGAVTSEIAPLLVLSSGSAYAGGLAFDGLIVLMSALLAWRVGRPGAGRSGRNQTCMVEKVVGRRYLCRQNGTEVKK